MKKLPTKEEIKTARAQASEARKQLREANKTLAKIQRRDSRPIRRRTPQAWIDFNTWLHDVGILMPAIVRGEGTAFWEPKHLAEYAAQAADQMKIEVDKRRPKTGEESVRFSRRRSWLNWQSQFDEFVHTLSANSSMDALSVITRATALTDAMKTVVQERFPKMKVK